MGEKPSDEIIKYCFFLCVFFFFFFYLLFYFSECDALKKNMYKNL